MIHQPAISIVVSFGLASTLFTQVAHRGTSRSAIENVNCPASEVHSSFSQPAPSLMWRQAHSGTAIPGLWRMLQVDGTWRGQSKRKWTSAESTLVASWVRRQVRAKARIDRHG
jgi:hypothetical protein